MWREQSAQGPYAAGVMGWRGGVFHRHGGEVAWHPRALPPLVEVSAPVGLSDSLCLSYGHYRTPNGKKIRQFGRRVWLCDSRDERGGQAAPGRAHVSGGITRRKSGKAAVWSARGSVSALPPPRAAEPLQPTGGGAATTPVPPGRLRRRPGGTTTRAQPCHCRRRRVVTRLFWRRIS